MGKVTVYHGDDTTVKNPKIIKEKTQRISVMVYCTIIHEQAECWAKRYDKPIKKGYPFNGRPF